MPSPRQMFVVGSFVVVAVLAATYLWLYRADVALREQRPQPGYHGAQARDKGVIVFVHGLVGKGVASAEGGKSTWRNEKTQAYWPELVRVDPAFTGYDVYVYEYFSPYVAGALAIDELADNMDSILRDAGILDYQEIVFVNHSMGGVLTRALLNRYRQYASRTRLLYFYATPTLGSDLARALALASDNPQADNVKWITHASYLADQLRGWINAGPEIASYCAYEKIKMPVLGLIVPLESAAALCGRRLEALNATHVGIVKPEDSADPIHIVFRNAFKEVHEKTYSFSVPSEWTLRQAIDTIAQGQQRTATYDSTCGADLLGAALEHDTIVKATATEVIATLATLLPDSFARFSIRATISPGGAYAITCTASS